MDVLKIDRSFIEHIASLARNDEIVQAIAALGRSLGLVTVSEGIEIEGAAPRTRGLLAADLGQGYLFAGRDSQRWHMLDGDPRRGCLAARGRRTTGEERA